MAFARVVQFGGKSPQMGFEPGAHLQRRRIHLHEAPMGEKIADCGEDQAALLQPLAAKRKPFRPPPFLHSSVLLLAVGQPRANFSTAAALDRALTESIS